MMCFFFHVITAITSTSLLASFGMIGCAHAGRLYLHLYPLKFQESQHNLFSIVLYRTIFLVTVMFVFLLQSILYEANELQIQTISI